MAAGSSGDRGQRDIANTRGVAGAVSRNCATVGFDTNGGRYLAGGLSGMNYDQQLGSHCSNGCAQVTKASKVTAMSLRDSARSPSGLLILSRTLPSRTFYNRGDELCEESLSLK